MGQEAIQLDDGLCATQTALRRLKDAPGPCPVKTHVPARVGEVTQQLLRRRESAGVNLQRGLESLQPPLPAVVRQEAQQRAAARRNSTFNEMRDKIDRRSAAAEAKMQLGTSSVDTQMQEIEREALDMQLQDKLLDYKREMGMLRRAAAARPPRFRRG